MEKNYLIHYGVPGMRWGVRHDPEPTNTPAYGKVLNGYDKYQKRVTRALGGKNTRANVYAAQAIARTVKSKNPSALQKALYTAHVINVTKKDNKKQRDNMVINKNDHLVTKKAKIDYNNMSDLEFRAKYKLSKDKYLKRVNKSKNGDPFMTRKQKGILAASLAVNGTKAVADITKGKRS